MTRTKRIAAVTLAMLVLSTALASSAYAGKGKTDPFRRGGGATDCTTTGCS